MRRFVSILFSAAVVGGALAGSSSANHGDLPHNCLGAFHAAAAQALGGVGEVASTWAQDPSTRPNDQTDQPFGQFVSERAQTCNL